jgi:hypothetical protein
MRYKLIQKEFELLKSHLVTNGPQKIATSLKKEAKRSSEKDVSQYFIFWTFYLGRTFLYSWPDYFGYVRTLFRVEYVNTNDLPFLHIYWPESNMLNNFSKHAFWTFETENKMCVL